MSISDQYVINTVQRIYTETKIFINHYFFNRAINVDGYINDLILLTKNPVGSGWDDWYL